MLKLLVLLLAMAGMVAGAAGCSTFQGFGQDSEIGNRPAVAPDTRRDGVGRVSGFT